MMMKVWVGDKAHSESNILLAPGKILYHVMDLESIETKTQLQNYLSLFMYTQHMYPYFLDYINLKF